MARWAVWLCLVLVAGCASAPPPQRPEALFDDRRFAPPAERIDTADVFALTDEMRRYIETTIAREFAAKGRQQGLIDALYRKGRLKLDYDTTTTRTASQAFAARSGNCLSLVIMTAAFAKEVGLPVRFNSVYIEDSWSRSGNLYLANGHVNVSLGQALADARTTFEFSPFVTIDFVAPSDLRGYRSREIGEETIVAMYLNNRAVEQLARGDVDAAYWWARAAIERLPTFMVAYNTLGVVYLQHGDLAHAERVFAQVLAIEPANTRALSNLAAVFDRAGRSEEAERLKRRLAEIEPYPPFHFFDRGVAAMERGDYMEAKRLFRKELERAAHYHEFHFWLALANLGLRDVSEARRHLKLALDNSTTRETHAIYAAKLERISAAQRRQ